MSKKILSLLTLLGFLLLLYDFGFDQEKKNQVVIWYGYYAILIVFIGLEWYQLLYKVKKTTVFLLLRAFFHITAVGLIMLKSATEGVSLISTLEEYEFLFVISVLLILIPILVDWVSTLYNRNFSPALVFTASFILLILLGAFLLMLPNAANTRVSFVDALFTSTSAVCVTGLAVLDTGKDFTQLGQLFIMILIQLGGLGMLTLTTFFAYFFKGSSSYQENLFIKDFLSSDQMTGLLELSLKIVIFTFALEMAGAVLIFFHLPREVFPSFQDQVFFSAFHSVSAFCNAGFSTLSGGLYEAPVRFNYMLHLLVALLFITGGLGYNIIFNLILYLKNKILSWYYRYFLREPRYLKTLRTVTLNTKIVLYTTFFLIFSGTGVLLFTEWNHTLAGHPTLWGKVVTAFFSATTPRTAGFNTVDMTALSMPTIMVVLLLMWIGASPASTGGGIKTSTFALATLNILSTVTGKNRIELGSREVPQESLNRAFSIISLSLIVIGFAVLFLAAIEHDKSFIAIAFECFSAFSTVGLSLGITAGLNDYSKVILVAVMFLGRVGTINILIGILKQDKVLAYHYPKEPILIN